MRSSKKRRTKKNKSIDGEQQHKISIEKSSESDVTSNSEIDIIHTLEKENIPRFPKNKWYEKILMVKDELLKTKDELINSKNIIIEELGQKIEFLQEKIEFFTKNDREKYISYANKVGNKSNGNQYHEEKKEEMPTVSNSQNIKKKEEKSFVNTLIIKPISVQECKTTKKEVAQHVNPAQLNVEISGIQNLKDGSIKISCKSKNEIEKIKDEVTKTLSKKYIVNNKNGIRPKIKIVGIDDELTEDELKKNIVEKNAFVSNLDMKLIVFKKMKTKFMAIIELDPQNFQKIIEKGVIFIDFAVCSVYKQINILRCYKCSGYHHTAKNCSKSQICMKCENSDHTANECNTSNENIICPNCQESNQKLGLAYFINHSPFDIQCQTFQHHLEIQKRKVNYSTTDEK